MDGTPNEIFETLCEALNEDDSISFDSAVIILAKIMRILSTMDNTFMGSKWNRNFMVLAAINQDPWLY